MKTRFAKVLVLFTLVIAMVAMTALPAMAVNGSVDLLDTQVNVSTSDASSWNWNEPSGTITVIAKGSIIGNKTTNITILNNSGNKATVSFDYTASSCNSFTIGNANVATSGSYSAVLEAGSTVVVSMKSNKGLSNVTATVTLSNFNIVIAKDSSNVTVEFDNTLGNMTAAGNAVNSGDVVEGVTLADGVDLVATANSGTTFLGWINADTGEVLSSAASFTLKPSGDLTVKPAFASATDAWFWANGTSYLFDDLNKASDYASTAASKTVVLANNGTLTAGSYTVDAGVTLLIPFDSANTLYTEKPGTSDTYTKPTAYRTLTMASGASITVNGALSVSGKQCAAFKYNGMPTGPLGFIKMNSGSSISIESGAYLYAWGYITGYGSVAIKDGGTVYECFQLADYRGGDATSSMTSNTYGVFPMSQYYLQNVEVPMTLYAGANEFAYMSVTVTLLGTKGGEVPFVGNSDAMFKITSGYVVKDYIEGKGRLKVSSYGDIEVSTIAMSMNITGWGNTNIDSSNFNLPISNHMTIDAVSGTVSLAQDLVLYPGSELYIREGVTCNLTAGTRIVVFDLDQWGGYCGASNVQYAQLKYVPGGDSTEGRLKDALVQIDGTVNAKSGAVYTTAGGANVKSTGTGIVNAVPGTETETYYASQDADKNITYNPIVIQPALLKNADGTFVDTSAESGTYTYYVSTGRWDKPGHFYESVVTDPTCTAEGYTTHTCAVCGDSYQDTVVDAIGHTEVIDAAEEATCTETGLTEGKHCSVCNEVLTAQEKIPALGHTEESIPAVDATCEAPGWTEGTVCTACGTVLVAQEETPALGHTEVIDEAVDATCTATGLTEGAHCDRCKEILIAQEVVPAAGHSYETSVIDPTCTEEGYTEYTCGICKDHYIGDKVSALGHDEVIDEGKDATCTATGLTEGKHCDRCKEVLTAQEVISALGHTEVIDEAVEATCTATGLTEGKHCSVCDEVLTAQNVIPANGHSYGNWDVTAPTYVAAGSQSKTCSLCGDVVTEEIPVLANPVTNWNITLKDNIGVNFVMNLAENDEVTVTVNGNPVKFTQENGKFSINVAAAQMMDEIAISVNDLPLAKTYSVRGYADKILEDPAQSACHKLVKNMLVYGGAAQTYFGYNSENEKDLASYGIEVETVVPAGDGEVAVTDSLSAISFYGATLVHETKTAVRIYFTGSIEGLTFKANGNKVDATAKDDMYYVEVSGINPQDLDNDVTVVVTDGTNELTVAYSPLDYIVRMYNKAGTSAALVQALYGYYLAAAAYTA